MAFNELTKGQKIRGRALSRVSIGKYGKNGTATIRISNDVAEEMNWPPYFSISIGSEEHSGLVMLRPHFGKSQNSYRAIYASKNSGCQISVGSKRIGLHGTRFKTVEVPYELTDGGLIFRIPNVSHMAVAAE